MNPTTHRLSLIYCYIIQKYKKKIEVIRAQKNDDFVSLRGYMVLAQTPFGWDNFDMSDYGITLYAQDDEIVKCRLDMFDRNTYIEYYK